jgi:hypothetical protein
MLPIRLNKPCAYKYDYIDDQKAKIKKQPHTYPLSLFTQDLRIPPAIRTQPNPYPRHPGADEPALEYVGRLGHGLLNFGDAVLVDLAEYLGDLFLFHLGPPFLLNAIDMQLENLYRFLACVTAWVQSYFLHRYFERVYSNPTLSAICRK